jgi:hypothetical protein
MTQNIKKTYNSKMTEITKNDLQKYTFIYQGVMNREHERELYL